MISCLLIASHRHERLAESIQSFLTQNFTGEKELLIYSDSRQKLIGTFEGVRIFNVLKAVPKSAALNFLVGMAKFDKLLVWEENSIALPNHLTNIVPNLTSLTDGAHWVWLDKELSFQHGRMQTAQGSTGGFAFTKTAWEKSGKFKMNSASEGQLVGEITKRFDGKKVSIQDSEIALIRRDPPMGMRRFSSGDIKLNLGFKDDYAGLAKKFWEAKAERRVGIVLLCKFGDIICILPILKKLFDEGNRPALFIHQNFANLLDGVSYVEPRIVTFNANDVVSALAMAKREFQIVFNAQVWGKGLKQKRECSSFNREAWQSLGMGEHFDNMAMKPLFDRRDLEREAKLIADHIPPNKPYILVNLKSQTSPCPACAGLMDAITDRWGDLFSIIDLAKITAHRLYDFVGMMEKAHALVTVDTAFLHLAAATNIPIVALTNPKPWLGSTPRGNVVSRITYTEAVRDAEQVQSAVGKAVASI